MKKYNLILTGLFFFLENFAIAQTSVSVTMSGSGITQSGAGYETCMTGSNGSVTLTANVTNPPNGTLNFDWSDDTGPLSNTGSNNTLSTTYTHGMHKYHVKVTFGGSSPATSPNVQLDAYNNYNGVQENASNQPSVILNTTDASYDLKQLLKSSTINGANIVFTTDDPTYSSAIISGNKFDPSVVPPGSYVIDYTVSDNGHCPNNYVLTTKIVILDPQATIPSFLKGLDPLPVCENKISFRLFAYIDKLDLTYVNSYPPSSISIDITDKNGTHTITGFLIAFNSTLDPIYFFSVDPSQHIVNNYALQFKITSVISTRQSFYSGYIPIFPRRNPFMLGLPTPVSGQINLCSASNDTIFMRGTPASPVSYGSYNYYSGIPVIPATIPASYIFTKIPNAAISPNAPANDPSLQKFIPSEIFKNQLGSDINNVFKIVYTYPANASGSCPDSISNIINFQPHTNTSFVTTNPASKPYCYGDTLILNIVNNAAGDKYTWDFGDGVSTSIDSALTYRHFYGKAGSFNLRLKTFSKVLQANLCNNDTIVSIRIGAKPVANFDVFNNFEGKPSNLKSLSKILVPNISSVKDTIYRWYWDLGVDPTTRDTNRVINNLITKSNDTSYTYAATRRNPYRVVHAVVSRWGCMDSLVRNIPVFPVDTPLTTSNKIETFDNPTAANGWFESGQYLQVNNKQSSWDNITASKNIIKSNDPCWITVKAKAFNQDTSGYYNNEYSYVESPAYSLVKLALPMVSFNTWTQSDNFFDGATFQYTLCDSAFGKEKWVTIGSIGQGLDWYNSKTIISSPGGKPASGKNLLGWTGTENLSGWKLSAYRLNNLKDSLAKYPAAKYVRFRIAFSSNGDNTPDKIFDGFAFDNFFVGQRNRKVITEEFCDYKNYEPTFQSNPLDPQIVRLQYHVRNQNPDDQINKQNMADPSARALLYGIDRIPRAVVDGTGFQDNAFYTSASDPKSGWGSDAFFKRSLQLSPFNISVSHAVSGNNNVSVSANITQNAGSTILNPNASLVAQIVVMEDAVVSNGILFTNVVRSMVPDASGHHIGKWTGSQQTLSGSWKPFVKPQSGLKIVVFLQDEDTKEIYQASVDSIDKATAIQFSVARVSAADHTGDYDFNLYPNPTSGDLTIAFYQALPDNTSWKVTDVFGSQVLSGTAAAGSSHASVVSSGLTNGVYHLQLENSGQQISKTFTLIR